MPMTTAEIITLAASTPEQLHIDMCEAERRLGYTIVTQAPWLDWNDWHHQTIVSKRGNRVRLALLKARVPGQGAFTRLIKRITEAKLMPAIAEPDSFLVDWCLRHEFRSRMVAIGTRDQHVVWYPRLCLNFEG